MYQLFESIKVQDAVVQNLEYHQWRVDWSVGRGRVDLQSYILNLELPTEGCWKLRISYCRLGVLHHQMQRYERREIGSLMVVEDDTIEYSMKFENRAQIERLRELRGGCDDVLIAGRGLVRDCSFANVVFFDEKRWETPVEPLLRGSCRQRLLDGGVIFEREISLAMIEKYSKVLLINAMVGFDPRNAISTQYIYYI